MTLFLLLFYFCRSFFAVLAKLEVLFRNLAPFGMDKLGNLVGHVALDFNLIGALVERHAAGKLFLEHGAGLLGVNVVRLEAGHEGEKLAPRALGAAGGDWCLIK